MITAVEVNQRSVSFVSRMEKELRRDSEGQATKMNNDIPGDD